MWRSYDGGTVSEELRVLRDHGLTMTRSFFYWPDFMPEPDRIDEQMAARFADFLDRHTAAGLTTVPTFLVGRMSGETSGVDNGFRLTDIAPLCDFIGPHCYPMQDDPIRQHYAAAWKCELAGTFGRPVVLEEFGASSDHVSGENAAHYYRQVLANSLLAGATGWIAWNNTDFDAPGQDPYRHHAFELHFGLTGADGRPKPPLAEMKSFARTLRAIDAAHCERAPADAALIVPSYLGTGYPFTDPGFGPYLEQTLAQAYVSARLADLPVALARESEGIGDDARLYLLPSVKQLLATTPRGWRSLPAAARASTSPTAPGPAPGTGVPPTTG
jgi:endo-1,4-beta-mannosidase